jgi:molecular chaperone DnaK (HSP70)
MARIGIDFGTTNTVVVASDRGRYPVVPHAADTAIGRIVRDVFPSLVAWDAGQRRLLFGPEAERWASRGDGAGVIRSLKRLLRDWAGGGRIAGHVRPDGFDTLELLTAFASALKSSLDASGLFPARERLEAVITWPANANGAQRWVTRAAFRQAGFDVVGTLSEPAAAAIEYANRFTQGDRPAARRVRATILVFDFGGGTFDASLVRIDGTEFTVLDTAGIEALGGDDLDDVLARLFAKRMKLTFDELSPLQRELLTQHARRQKESIAAGGVRSLTLVPRDVGLKAKPCTVPVTTYFKALGDVVSPAIDAVDRLVGGHAAARAGVAPEGLDAIYLVGGSSRLPLVSKLLAARLPGLRQVMTDKPFTATAMGAAIHAADTVTMHDILSRHFGVIRLADHGQREVFDPIFPAGMRLPPRGTAPVERRVEYAPRHNIGHLRYLECAGVDDAGRPALGVRAWSDVLFPYDPAIPVDQRVTPSDVRDREDLLGAAVSETYECDGDGVISVRVTRPDGQSRSFEIFRP